MNSHSVHERRVIERRNIVACRLLFCFYFGEVKRSPILPSKKGNGAVTFKCGNCATLVAMTSILLLVPPAGVTAQEQANQLEKLDPAKFTRSTVIDNPWLPLKPGTRMIWAGTSVDEEGVEESHSLVCTVTDLTKVIGGVRTVVCWERDIVDRELEEAEISFYAQDDEGNVWYVGEYPEEYDNKRFVQAPCWIHGINDGRAGIAMKAKPALGTPSYSQGWAPSVEFTDRAFVYQMGQKTTVPAGTYEDVLVIDEANREEPDSHALKYYARGVGNVRVGSRGTGDQESLELISVETLSAEELARARAGALKLEQHAYEVSKDVYGRTTPAEPVRNGVAGQ
jgi:hypothetical protein